MVLIQNTIYIYIYMDIAVFMSCVRCFVVCLVLNTNTENVVAPNSRS